MRIDSHQHFWKFNRARDSWITENMSVLHRDFLPQDLRPELESHNMDGSIAVQTDQSEAETRFLLDLAATCPQILGVVGWLDLCSSNIRESLHQYANCKKLRGVRHIVQAEPDDRFLVRDAFMRGIACLGHFGLTYDILVYTHQLPAAAELVAKFPDQLFVVDHIAKPEIRHKKTSPWRQYIQEIAKHQNLYCKISGLITEADWQNWSEYDIAPYLDIVFEAFGIDRVMFGSDWPVCLLAGSYSRVVDLISRYTEAFSEADRANIFGLNAARFYGLEKRSF
jgi:L-fucono-1,5-lactonase